MLRTLRGHLGHNAIAYAALFVALGGSAAAATPLITGADIQDESLTAADVKNGSLIGADVGGNQIVGAHVRDGALVASDVQDNALTGADIKDNALTGSDLTESSLAKVPTAGHADLAGDAHTLQGMSPQQIAASAGAIVWKRARSAGEIIVAGNGPAGDVDLGTDVTVDLPEGGFVFTAVMFEGRCTHSGSDKPCAADVGVKSRGTLAGCGTTPVGGSWTSPYRGVAGNPIGGASCYVSANPAFGGLRAGSTTFHLTMDQSFNNAGTKPLAYTRNRELWVGVLAPPPLAP